MSIAIILIITFTLILVFSLCSIAGETDERVEAGARNGLGEPRTRQTI